MNLSIKSAASVPWRGGPVLSQRRRWLLHLFGVRKHPGRQQLNGAVLQDVRDQQKRIPLLQVSRRSRGRVHADHRNKDGGGERSVSGRIPDICLLTSLRQEEERASSLVGRDKGQPEDANQQKMSQIWHGIMSNLTRPERLSLKRGRFSFVFCDFSRREIERCH